MRADCCEVLVRPAHVVHQPEAHFVKRVEEFGELGLVERLGLTAAGRGMDDVVAVGSESCEVGERAVKVPAPGHVVGVGKDGCPGCAAVGRGVGSVEATVEVVDSRNAASVISRGKNSELGYGLDIEIAGRRGGLDEDVVWIKAGIELGEREFEFVSSRIDWYSGILNKNFSSARFNNVEMKIRGAT